MITPLWLLRRAYGLTRHQVAEISGVNESTLCRYETGRMQMHADTFAHVSRCLALHLSERSALLPRTTNVGGQVRATAERGCVRVQLGAVGGDTWVLDMDPHAARQFARELRSTALDAENDRRLP